MLLKIKQSITIIDTLDQSKNYQIAFSGGKDSHALLICFLIWQQLKRIKTDNFKVIFSDTRLEENMLYQTIDKIELFLTQNNIKFERVYPQKSYWYYQFAYGYPVPNWKNRWCTKFLKVLPMKSKELTLTGRHYGESSARDKRLSNCSSGECGVDKIPSALEPIVNFDNCDVWDLIYYADNTILYDGVFNLLKATYSGNIREQGSLRMGCFMCPVVGIKSINEGIDFRNLLEDLRLRKRIKSPRFVTIKEPPNFLSNKREYFNQNERKYIFSCLMVTVFLVIKSYQIAFAYLGFYVLGAIHIKERRAIWEKINKEKLLVLNFISLEEIEEINKALESDYSYPKSYSQKWIDSQHKREL